MTIQFQCSHCGARAGFSDDMAGQTIQCGQCGRQTVLQHGGECGPLAPADENDILYIGPGRSTLWLQVFVVTATLGVLLALLLPYVLKSHVRGRRSVCVNNLRNLALATNNFEAIHNRYPGSQELLLGMDPAAIPANEPGHNKPASWMAVLLEGLDRADLAERWNSKTVALTDPALAPSLEFAVCPESSHRAGTTAGTSYVANAGFMPRSWADASPFDEPEYLKTAQRPANGVFLDRITLPNRSVRSSDIRDGASNTLLLTENLSAQSWNSFGPLDPSLTQLTVNHGWSTDVVLPVERNARFGNTFVWCYAAELNFPGADPPFQQPNGASIPPQTPPAPKMKINGQRRIFNENAKVFAEIARPSSNHPGGVNAAFADGSVRFLTDDLAYHVYQQLMTPNGVKSDMPSRCSYVLRDVDYCH